MNVHFALLVKEPEDLSYRDKVNVQLIKVSLETRQIDFIIIDESGKNDSEMKRKNRSL